MDRLLPDLQIDLRADLGRHCGGEKDESAEELLPSVAGRKVAFQFRVDDSK
jgi:hypothetical protein